MDFSTLIEAFKPFARLLCILVALVFIGILLDYLTGTIAAKRNNEWSSKIAREGIWHKVGIIIAILLGVLLDIVVIVASRSVLNIQLSFSVFSPLVALCYVITEFGSILENLRKMGTEVPAILIKGFASLKHSVNAHADAAVPDTVSHSAEAAPLSTVNTPNSGDFAPYSAEMSTDTLTIGEPVEGAAPVAVDEQYEPPDEENMK